MEPMTAALILAGVGAGVGYLGGERQRKAQEKAQEQFRKDTAEQERKALIASAYGLGGVAPAQMQAPTADPLMGWWWSNGCTRWWSWTDWST